ncbi:MAG TPA: CGNR zinc finger domain-containing protein [Verrucomicrobiae bacterium]|jgi:predicted RNA-binding Zn ribbon-like protein|nr:CGNR zinc finger domain-containing protein [Verrucomicrobiae bacterium]
MSTDPTRALLQFFGGRVCLDFANTMDWRTSKAPQELLPDYATLLLWSGKRGTLPAPAVGRLRSQARRRTAAAASVLVEARVLRAEICKAAEALCRGERVQPGPFNRRLAALPAQPRLVRSGAGYVHDLPGKSLEEPLWPVLWSLSALLTSQDAGRLGFCQAEGCGWFFVDESPNHARTWCSSEVCGNRERARRAYAKRIRRG